MNKSYNKPGLFATEEDEGIKQNSVWNKGLGFGIILLFCWTLALQIVWGRFVATARMI